MVQVIAGTCGIIKPWIQDLCQVFLIIGSGKQITTGMQVIPVLWPYTSILKSIDIFPNPWITGHKPTLELNGFDNSLIRIILYDMNDKVQYDQALSFSVQQALINLDLPPQLNAGQHFLSVDDGKDVQALKLLIK